jgi:sigma-B regulation protein RsbU (phosphoserine phosphatase)
MATSASSPPHTNGTWQQWLTLATQLLSASSVAEAQAVITAAVQNLVGGEARLWIADPFGPTLDVAGGDVTPGQPPTELMREAVATGRSQAARPPAIALPLRTDKAAVGVLELKRSGGPAFDPDDLSLLEAIADQAAAAIERAHHIATSEAQAWISTVLLQVSDAIQSVRTLEDALDTVVRLTPLLTGVDRCALLLWNAAQEAFVPGAAYGLSEAEYALFETHHLPVSEAAAFQHLRLLKEPLRIADTAADARLPATIGAELGFGSLIMLPLVVHDETIGAMLVEDASGQSEFESEWRAMLQGIAHQTATAVEGLRQMEAQQEEAYVLASLLQVAQTVASFEDLDETLNSVLRILAIMVGVKRAILYLWDDEHTALAPAATYGLPAADLVVLAAQSYQPGTFGLLDRLCYEGETLLLRAADGWDDLVPAAFEAEFLSQPGSDRCTLLAVPLTLQRDVLGAMIVEEAEASRRFREQRMEIITGVAQQIALAAQNDRLRREMAARERLEQELLLAREIQLTLMPTQPPSLTGWELAAICRPALQVGGDFYDFFELPDGRLGLVIADVADKGMPAALFMALTRTLIRAAALEHASPAAAVARANDLLVPDAHQGMFVTAVYATLALDTGQLAYANAGHNPPLLYRTQPLELEALGHGGFALGIAAGAGFEQGVAQLRGGDCVVFYTDGVTEAFGPDGDIFGAERLYTVTRELRGESAPVILDAIQGSVARFVADQPPSDDLTLMVLRRQRD